MSIRHKHFQPHKSIAGMESPVVFTRDTSDESSLLSPWDVLRRVRDLDLKTPSEAVTLVRSARDSG